MFNRPNFILAVILVAAWLVIANPGSRSVCAQDQKSGSNDEIELSKLDTFLKNKDGKLIQYFNITFEEFERVYNSLNAATVNDTSRQYVIRSTEVVAKVRNQSVMLEISLDVELRVDQEVDVALGFDNFIFPVTDTNQSLFRRDKKFYVRVKGAAGKTQKIKLLAQQNVRKIRGRKQLEFQLPDATFTKVQVHELESGVQFSPSQDAIQKSVTPFFARGSAIEFSGLKENATITWVRMQEAKLQGKIQVDGSPNVEAVIHPDRVDYKARFSIKSVDPLSQLELGLPQNTSQAAISNDATLTQSGTTQDAWKIYRIDWGQPTNLFEDVEVTWTVPHSLPNPSLVGFEVIGVPMFSGQLNVRGAGDLSFVIGNRFNLTLNQDNGQTKSYQIQSSMFSASLFTVVDTPNEKNEVNFALQLDANSAELAMTIPRGSFKEDSNGVSISLNGWKVVSGQKHLSVDSLLREVAAEPPFFLDAGSRLTIQFELNESMLGDREFRFPQVKDTPIDAIQVSVSCSDQLEARFDGNRNPGFEFDSEFESEIIATGSPLKLSSAGNQTAALKLNLKPILPLVEATQIVHFRESKGKFRLEIVCDISSSKPLESCALVVHQDSLMNLVADGTQIPVSSISPSEPVLIELQNQGSVQIKLEFELPSLAESQAEAFRLPEFLVPVTTKFDQANADTREVQGRSFQSLQPESRLTIMTSAAITVRPDDRWTKDDSNPGVGQSEYEGRYSDSIQFTKTASTDDDVFVEKTWCHTSLNSEFRQDRIVIRFVPQRSMINWQIPEGTKLVSCKLNGSPIGATYGRDRYEVKVGFDEFSQSQTIEFNLRYFHSTYDSKLQLKLPKTDRLLWSKNLYWSLELPDNQYVLNYSNSMSASYVLAWTGFFLRPTPTYTVKQLERWIDTDHANELDLRGNDYLFASFGIVDQSYVYVISKRNLVLIFGLFFISLGCAFVSLSFMRNALFLIAIAAGILIFGMWYPIWFVQLLQIEIFVAFLFGLGFIITRITTWLNPAKDETTIETNIPSIALAAPDSGYIPSTQTRYQPSSGSEGNQ